MAISKQKIRKWFFSSKSFRGVLSGLTEIFDGLCAILSLGRLYPGISFRLIVWWELERYRVTDEYQKYLRSKYDQ